MKYTCTLFAVSDMEASKRFYRDVLGCEVICDFGANVTLTGGFALQTLDTWKDFISRGVSFDGGDGELYFEEDDMDAFVLKLSSMPDIQYVHTLKEHAWGQRVVRFYDPDRHIIEVGENLAAVVRRFIDGGMSVEQAAKRMGIQEDYVRHYLG